MKVLIILLRYGCKYQESLELRNGRGFYPACVCNIGIRLGGIDVVVPISAALYLPFLSGVQLCHHPDSALKPVTRYPRMLHC